MIFIKMKIKFKKFLFSYSEIIAKNIEDFNKNDIQNLSEFILGISVTGNNFSFDLKTSRSNNTHNIYFDVIRKYIEYADIKNDNFFEKVSVPISEEKFSEVVKIYILKQEEL